VAGGGEVTTEGREGEFTTEAQRTQRKRRREEGRGEFTTEAQRAQREEEKRRGEGRGGENSPRRHRGHRGRGEEKRRGEEEKKFWAPLLDSGRLAAGGGGGGGLIPAVKTARCAAAGLPGVKGDSARRKISQGTWEIRRRGWNPTPRATGKRRRRKSAGLVVAKKRVTTVERRGPAGHTRESKRGVPIGSR
jgi:hypothetical protein